MSEGPENEESKGKKKVPDTSQFETLVRHPGSLGDEPTVAPEDQVTMPPEQTLSPDEAPTMVTGIDPAVEPGEERTMAPQNLSDAATMGGPQDDDVTMDAGHTRPSTQGGSQAANLVAEAPVIDGYQITGKIGEGGMGVVWKAIQLSTNRTCALKLLPPNSIGSGKAQQRFQREVETAAKLEHPHICGVYDSGINRGVYFYAMQAVDGVELHDYIAEHQLDLRSKLQLMIKICKALHYAHQHGIIHRDLKPGNILVTHDGEPSILDFGLAKSVDRDSDLSMAGEVVGTPMYMSTEQARGDVDNLDGRTDVYSLGVMLFEQSCGSFPYDATGGPYAIIQRKFDTVPYRPTQFNRDIDLDLEAVVLKSLHADAGQRHLSAEDLAADLQNYLDGRPVSARRHTVSYVGWLWFRRNAVKLGAVALLLALIGGGYAFQQWRSEQERIADADRIRQEAAADKLRLAQEKQAAEQQLKTKDRDNLESAFQVKLDELELALEGKDLGEANTISGQLQRLVENTNILSRAVINDVLAGFADRKNALDASLLALQEAERNKQLSAQAMTEKTRAIVQILSTITPTGLQDLNPKIFDMMDTRFGKFDPALHRQEAIQAQLVRIQEGIERIAAQHLRDRSNLDGRRDRLKQLGAFLKDPRLALRFPGLAPVLAEYDKEAALFVVELANITGNPVQVQSDKGLLETIPGGENRQLEFRAEDGPKIVLAINTTKAGAPDQPDLRKETKRLLVGFEPGGGLFSRITSFGEVTIPIHFPPPGDLENDEIAIAYCLYPEFPKEETMSVGEDAVALPARPWHLRFTRYDHETIQTSISLLPSMKEFFVEHPKDTEWTTKPYVGLIAAAEKHLAAEELAEGLALVDRVQENVIDSARMKGRYRSLRDRLSNHPLRRLQQSLPVAQAEVEDFVESMIQRHDPLAKRWGPQYRFEADDHPVPGFALPAMRAEELAALSPGNRARFQLAATWQQLSKQLKDLEKPAHREGRSLAGSALQQFLSNQGALDAGVAAEAKAQLAVMQRADKGDDPPGPVDGLSHPILLKWYGHAQYRAEDYERCADALKAFEKMGAAGGSLDRFDTSILCFSGHFAFANVVKSVRIEGMHAAHPAYVAEKERAEQIFRSLAKSVGAIDAAEFKTLVETWVTSDVGDKERFEQYIEIINFMGQLPMKEASKEAAAAAFKELQARHKEKYGEVKRNSNVVKNNNALNAIIAEVAREYLDH